MKTNNSGRILMTPGVTAAPFSEAMPAHPQNGDEVIAVNVGSSTYTLTGSITGGSLTLDAAESAILVWAGDTWAVTWNSGSGGLTFPIAVAIGGTGRGDGAFAFAGMADPAPPPAGTALLHAKTPVTGVTRLEVDNAFATNVVVGRDTVFVVKNATVGSIPKFALVYASGQDSGIPTIDYADASDVAKMPCIGTVLNDIAAGAYGQVMRVGIAEDLDLSMFAVGDQLYVSPSAPGSATTTRPVAPNIVQLAAIVLSNDAVVGEALATIAPALLGVETGTNSPTFTAPVFLATGTGITAGVAIGSGVGVDATINLTAILPGVVGNVYTVEIVSGAPTPDVALGVVEAGTVTTITLGTDGAGVLDPAKNTATLVLAELGASTLFTGALAGTGDDSLTVESQIFFGGAEAITAVTGNVAGVGGIFSGNVDAATFSSAGGDPFVLPAADLGGGGALVTDGSGAISVATLAVIGTAVSLQVASPGTPDSGNFNVSGAGIIGGISFISSAPGDTATATAYWSATDSGANTSNVSAGIELPNSAGVAGDLVLRAGGVNASTAGDEAFRIAGLAVSETTMHPVFIGGVGLSADPTVGGVDFGLTVSADGPSGHTEVLTVDLDAQSDSFGPILLLRTTDSMGGGHAGGLQIVGNATAWEALQVGTGFSGGAMNVSASFESTGRVGISDAGLFAPGGSRPAANLHVSSYGATSILAQTVAADGSNHNPTLAVKGNTAQTDPLGIFYGVDGTTPVFTFGIGGNFAAVGTAINFANLPSAPGASGDLYADAITHAVFVTP